tara:strand:+ start:913 stop:1335 length:423 start_codon:yes stop_codon:yes gene_type:complete
MLGTAEVTMLGRVVAPPEVQETSVGGVMQLRIAVNEKRKNGEHTSWWTVEVWNEKNQAALSKVNKGEPLLIFATMSNDQFQSKSGDKITATRLRMEKFRFLGGTRKEEETKPQVNSAPDLDKDTEPQNNSDPDLDEDIAW